MNTSISVPAAVQEGSEIAIYNSFVIDIGFMSYERKHLFLEPHYCPQPISTWKAWYSNYSVGGNGLCNNYYFCGNKVI